jgi:lipopolysaccharide transport system permease protein
MGNGFLDIGEQRESAISPTNSDKTMHMSFEKTKPDGPLITVIEQRSGWRILNLGEMLHCGDLFYFLIRRDIKSAYAQTVLGLAWAILQPSIQIILFTCVFGGVAKISTDGIPYILFTTVAVVPWNYISQSMTASSLSLVAEQHMLSKIYFPRLIYPLISVVSKLVEFLISIVIIVGVMIYYHVLPTRSLLLFPVLVLTMMCLAAGTGMWLSPMAVRFRDVNHALSFVIRMLMYTAPIAYPMSAIAQRYRRLYSLNPIVGIIEGFRASMLGFPIPWQCILQSVIVCLLLLMSGAFYFKRIERIFVDVI